MKELTQQPSFTCPFCHRRSYHPNDIAASFCTCCGGPGLPKMCEHRPAGPDDQRLLELAMEAMGIRDDDPDFFLIAWRLPAGGFRFLCDTTVELEELAYALRAVLTQRGTITNDYRQERES